MTPTVYFQVSTKSKTNILASPRPAGFFAFEERQVMKLSSEWIDHMPDTHPHAKLPMISVDEGEACECGLTEMHQHCGGCGKLFSKGNWRDKGKRIKLNRPLKFPKI